MPKARRAGALRKATASSWPGALEVHLVLLVELLVLVEPLDYRLDYNHREERQGALGAESDHFCATLKGQVLARLLVSLS